MRPFELHYDQEQVRALCARLTPAALQALTLGVASAGFQCEGGFNGPGQPRNQWADWEGRFGVAASGGACRFWERYPEDLALLQEHGLRCFRLSLEWARLEPGPPLGPTLQLDRDALAHYARILAALTHAGIEPLVTLYHWTHPHHLGVDFWLDERSPARFEQYVRALLPQLLDALEAAGGQPPRRFITLNEPNMFALATYLAGRFPHGAKGPAASRRALTHQLLAHLAVTRTVRELYAARGLPTPALSFNNNFSALYRLDALFVDLLLAPRAGVPRAQLPAYLRAREDQLVGDMLRSEGALEPGRRALRWSMRLLEKLLRAGTTQRQLAKLVDASYAMEAPALDYLAFDYYDPFPWSVLGVTTRGSDRGFGLIVDEWEWRPHPRSLAQALAFYSQAAPGLPLWLTENGMAVRGVGGKSFPRPDGARRDRFIQAHLYELLGAIADGVPVQGYLHWSLWDNYEWGSYQPRFGLIGLDAVGGAVERTPLDALGTPALAALGAIARAARSGNPTALAGALGHAR